VSLPARHRVLRFAVVGLASNALLYVAYLLMTSNGLGHKSAATVAFVLGVTQTFFANRNWTFGDIPARRGTYLRYGVAYAAAYFLNLGLLVVFVDLLGFPHRIVQGVLVLLIAGGLFLAQRYWVFDKVAPAIGTPMARSQQE